MINGRNVWMLDVLQQPIGWLETNRKCFGLCINNNFNGTNRCCRYNDTNVPFEWHFSGLINGKNDCMGITLSINKHTHNR